MLFKCRRTLVLSLSILIGKFGRIASEEVIIQLLLSKCRPVPILMYGLEACPLKKSDIKSLDFVVDRFFMKLFETNNMEII